MIDLFYPLTQPDSFWDGFGFVGAKRLRRRRENLEARSERQPVALLVGSTKSAEIQYAVEPLLNFSGCYEKPFGIDIRVLPSTVEPFELSNDLSAEPLESPDLILLLESYPGEYRESDVDSLKSRFPLAPIVLIYSSWGYGETRTGLPLSVLLRVSWLEAPIWLDAQLTRFMQGRLSLLSVPGNASRSQLALFEFLLSPEDAAGSPSTDIILMSDSEAMRRLFLDWSAALGRQVRTFRHGDTESVCRIGESGSKPTILCLDFDDPKESDFNEFRTVRKTFPQSRILVYLSQPRFKQVNRFYQAGANLVYPK